MKHIESLTSKDLESTPVWEFANNDEHGETAVLPVEKVPVSTLDGRIVATRVRLAGGRLIWALISNVSIHNRESTEQFLVLSVMRRGKFFTLARYHDFNYSENGPDALARFLHLDVDEVFPISYDISSLVKGKSDVLIGQIAKEPRKKLTQSALVELAMLR